jgi:hypothetical protein
MTLCVPASLQSRTNAGHSILYTHRNKDVPHSLLFCYGAGGDSRLLTRYQNFITAQALSTSLVSIDRWTQGLTAAQTSPDLFSKLTSITLELLTDLKIAKSSIAALSAGTYQMLHRAINATTRIRHIFPISTHVPAPFTSSKNYKFVVVRCQQLTSILSPK